MSIERGDFDQISSEDLEELVLGQVPESIRIEYKSQTYGNSGADRREFLKDISALANAQGGHLLIGVSENNGVATQLVGLGGVNADRELLRLEQIARNGIAPRLQGLRIRAVPIANEQHIVVVRVPRSWRPPHRVIAENSNRFYLRHSAGVHEADVEELRMLFSLSTTALITARKFRDDRIEQIAAGEGARPLETGGRFIVHIFPVAASTGALSIDIEQAHRNAAAFRPLGATGFTPIYNYLGFRNERGGDRNHGYTQLFRNGALEATAASIVRARAGETPGIWAPTLEAKFFERYNNYLIGLRAIGVPPPLVVMLTLEGIAGCKYSVGQDTWPGEVQTIPTDALQLPECILEDFGDVLGHHQAIRPAFDALWNAAGYARASFFAEDGEWVGPE